MSATPRLYVEMDLAPQARVRIEGDQAHYLSRVMRLGVGDPVRVFNGRDGEFSGALASVGKNAVELELGGQERAQAVGADVWLLFAPLKKTRTDFLVEKAVEMGAAELRPVITERTDAREVRNDRLLRIAVEAAEQTERLDVPPVREAVRLEKAFDGWDPSRLVFYGDESGDDGGRPWGGEVGKASGMADVVRAEKTGSAAILVGPEGGFSTNERAWLRSLPYVRPVGLGPRILRAETAAVAALAIWQSVAGDWTGRD